MSSPKVKGYDPPQNGAPPLEKAPALLTRRYAGETRDLLRDHQASITQVTTSLIPPIPVIPIPNVSGAIDSMKNKAKDMFNNLKGSLPTLPTIQKPTLPPTPAIPSSSKIEIPSVPTIPS